MQTLTRHPLPLLLRIIKWLHKNFLSFFLLLHFMVCAGVGFCTEEVKMDRLPGWEPHSYGYHGDDGHAFSSSGRGRPYGPHFSTGENLLNPN
jgi:hypothetical protein